MEKNKQTIEEKQLRLMIKEAVNKEMVNEWKGAKIKKGEDGFNDKDAQTFLTQLSQKYPKVKRIAGYQLALKGEDFNLRQTLRQMGRDAGVEQGDLDKFLNFSVKSGSGNNSFSGQKMARMNTVIGKHGAEDSSNTAVQQSPDAVTLSPGGNQQIAELQKILVDNKYLVDTHGPQKNGVDGFAGPITIAAYNKAVADKKIDLSKYAALMQRVISRGQGQQQGGQNQQARLQQIAKELQNAGWGVTPPPVEAQGQVNKQLLQNVGTAALGGDRGNNLSLKESKLRNEIRKTLKDILNN